MRAFACLLPGPATFLFSTALVCGMAHAQTTPTFPPAAPPPSDAHTIEVQKAIEADMGCVGVALRTREFTAAEKCWAPEMVVNSPGNKVLTRAQVIAAMSQGKLDYKDTHRVVEHFSTVGETAIEMGREDYVPLTGPEAGKTLYRRYTNFYVHRDGKWLLLARQATIYDPTAVHY